MILMEKRPPVVGILGHIDHGKSTLLDYIRKTNITEKEAGGITQHISAYEITHKREDGREAKITFLDTPGHEAFANIRTRGANVADIVVLIVSGEDGVRPQTLEVYKYIQSNSIPYLVAITKMDKPNTDLDRTKQNLAENGIYVEGYGGDVSAIPVSAKTGLGVNELIEMVLLMSDLRELKGEKDKPGEGVIIESRLDPKRGIMATGIIKDGTVSTGEFAASTGTWAPLRFLLDAADNQVEELSFSSPVQIFGWDKLPSVGAEFKTFLKKDDALAYASAAEKTGTNAEKRRAIQHDSLSSQEESAYLPIIIKADTSGSLEAIEDEINKLSRERITPKIILSGVGTIGENDIKQAITTPGTIILGFHAKVDNAAKALAERSAISITLFDIIYELTDHVAKLLAEKEPRIEVEEITGSAKILKIFSTVKNKQVVGGRVLSGSISLNNTVKIIRRDSEIARGKIRELQQAKAKADSVIEGSEFGTLIESKTEIAPGDIIEAVTLVTK